MKKLITAVCLTIGLLSACKKKECYQCKHNDGSTGQVTVSEQCFYSISDAMQYEQANSDTGEHWLGAIGPTQNFVECVL